MNLLKKKKTVFLKAYFRKNLGDDMFVRYLLERYPEINFRAFVARSQTVAFQKKPNFLLVPRICLFLDGLTNRLFGKTFWNSHYQKKDSTMVHIGGSIFIEPKNFFVPKNFYYHPNLFYIGCNFGPYESQEYLDFIRRRIQKAKDVCFRDTDSFHCFSDLSGVRVAPDVLFGYPSYPEMQKGSGVGISVVSCNRSGLFEYADAYYQRMANLIDLLAEKKIPATLFSFCAGEGDSIAIREILSRSQTKKAEVYEYFGNIDEMLGKMNSCEYLLATRFHAMVIGWVLQKKVLPIRYSEKQTHVIADADYQGPSFSVREFSEADENEIFDAMCAAGYPEIIEELKKGAEDQFAALDREFSFQESER